MGVQVALLRGINVGGRNKVPMAQLRECLTGLGLGDVRTYIQSGNALFTTDASPRKNADLIEAALVTSFVLDSAVVRTLVLTAPQMAVIVAAAPARYGSEPETYRYDVAYLLDGDPAHVADLMPAHPEVDAVWPGPGVVYYRRLIAEASRSRLSKVVGTPMYQDLTMRNWNTTVKLAELAASD